PNVEIVAVADPRSDRLAQIKATYNIPFTYTDYQDLIARDDLDVVSVATPNFLHSPVAVAALQAGKHVLSEKPLARTVAEGEAMVKAAIENNRVLEVAFNHRRRGDVQVLKSYIDEGGLGTVYNAKAYWMRRAGIPGMGGWFTSREQAGGGPLIDLGVHALDMAMYLLGEPEVVAVSGMTYAELGPRGRGSRGDRVEGGNYEVEDLATAFIRLSGGVTLLLEASWAVYGRHGDDYGVVLHGTDGGADIDVVQYSWENTLTIYSDTAGVPAVVKPKVGRGGGHAQVVSEFVDIVRSNDWENHRGQEGLRRTQIIEAIYRSAVEGHELALTDVAEKL
ncbi:MAG: Gfo/Idh/MocA family oxidoreductase, partial [Anaerolineae bacterium]|nr:Gfo/Idh/MocA family oxidoreductase [Anaerolineae bacterium]